VIPSQPHRVRMGDAEDARAALQAFFAANKPRTPQSATNADSAEGAPGSMSGRFKRQMLDSLNKHDVVKQRKDIEESFQKVLDQVTPAAKFLPPARVLKPKNTNTVDVNLQTSAFLEPAKQNIPEPPVVAPVPDPEEGRTRQRCCVIVENTPAAQETRKRVDEEQRRLYQLDSRTTSLTRQLKNLRIEHWEKRRLWCHKETEIEKFLLANMGKLNGSAADLQAQKEEVVSIRQELLQAKQKVKHWSKQARRLDQELQQQLRPGGDVQQILAKHPAGEVFLPPMINSGDSDDASSRGWDDEAEYRQRMAAAAASNPVVLGSSDEEEEFSGSATRPPPPPSQQWRSVDARLNHDDDYEDDTGPMSPSDASSATSPSGQSGGTPSPSGTAGRGRLLGAPGGSLVKGSMNAGSDSSEDERKSSPKASKTPPASAATGGSVPPLPGAGPTATPEATLKVAAAPKVPMRSAADVDEVAEVSSEEIYSQDGDDSDGQSQSV